MFCAVDKDEQQFAKSWVCLALSFAPFAMSNLKFIFRASSQYHEELDRLRKATKSSA
jgi:hypothetical protein